MIVKSRLPALFGACGLTVWPFIFIVPSCIEDLPLIEHEKVHLKEQAKWLVLPWWVAYLLWPKFRLTAEVRAHRVQISVGGCTPEQAARRIVKNYMLKVSYAHVLSLLTTEPKNK